MDRGDGRSPVRWVMTSCHSGDLCRARRAEGPAARATTGPHANVVSRGRERSSDWEASAAEAHDLEHGGGTSRGVVHDLAMRTVLISLHRASGDGHPGVAEAGIDARCRRTSRPPGTPAGAGRGSRPGGEQQRDRRGCSPRSCRCDIRHRSSDHSPGRTSEWAVADAVRLGEQGGPRRRSGDDPEGSTPAQPSSAGLVVQCTHSPCSSSRGGSVALRGPPPCPSPLDPRCHWYPPRRSNLTYESGPEGCLLASTSVGPMPTGDDDRPDERPDHVAGRTPRPPRRRSPRVDDYDHALVPRARRMIFFLGIVALATSVWLIPVAPRTAGHVARGAVPVLRPQAGGERLQAGAGAAGTSALTVVVTVLFVAGGLFVTTPSAPCSWTRVQNLVDQAPSTCPTSSTGSAAPSTPTSYRRPPADRLQSVSTANGVFTGLADNVLQRRRRRSGCFRGLTVLLFTQPTTSWPAAPVYRRDLLDHARPDH